MAKFIPVDPVEIESLSDGRRGRVSYPLIKEFLETNQYVAMLDRTGMQQSLQSLSSSLGTYIRNHKVPVRLFHRKGQIYFMRLDINQDGSQNEDWSPELGMLKSETEISDAEPITPSEVAIRYKKEKGQITK